MLFIHRTIYALSLAVLLALSPPQSSAADVKAGDLTITDPWTRATPKAAKVAGGFMTITNNGTTADRLLGGSFAPATRVEIHETSTTNDVMRMRRLPRGLEIKPGETVVLKPGSFHVMFMGLSQQLEKGASVPGTLRFERAGDVAVTYSVRKLGAMRHGHHAMHGGHHHAMPPISVMGVHAMKPGKFMLGYRFMNMHMEDLKQGSDDISDNTVVTTVANHFAGLPGQPATIRVVPTEMDMRMHMFSAMYGVHDRITLMAMVPYIEKDMTMLTYAGGAGTTQLGTMKMQTSGIGDIRGGAIVKLLQGDYGTVNARLGLSFPTGSITETGAMLMPSGATMVRRLAYGTQLGSGTIDLLPALTYTGKSNAFSWGAQYTGTLRLESENDESYQLGNIHQLTGWLGYRWMPWLQTTARLNARTQGAIDGQDPNIVGPAIGADPDNYGGERLDGLLGVHFYVPSGPLTGLRLGVEGGLPIYENVNGTRLGADWFLRLGVTKHF